MIYLGCYVVIVFDTLFVQRESQIIMLILELVKRLQ